MGCNFYDFYEFTLTAENGAAVVNVPLNIPMEKCEWLEAQLHADASTGSASAPTLDAKIQTSIDGANWTDLFTFTQVGDGTAANERKEAHRAHATASLHFLGRFVRIVFTPDAATGTEEYVGNVHVIAGS